jgi:hypothetical protein
MRSTTRSPGGDRAHLHAFTLADGARISIRGPWVEPDDDRDGLDDTETTLSRLRLGKQFTFEFDFGDSWMHLCTVADEKVDPHEVYGEAPERPVPYWGWGWIPDQYGRRWDGDDGEFPVPPPHDPPLSDLPDLHYTWGSRAIRTSSSAAASARNDGGAVVVGPWTDTAEGPGRQDLAPWSDEAIQDLRKAVAQRDVIGVVDLMLRHDALEVAHVAAPGLIQAVEVGHDPARVVLARLLPRLDERGWLGDHELTEEFERVMHGDAGRPRPIPADLGSWRRTWTARAISTRAGCSRSLQASSGRATRSGWPASTSQRTSRIPTCSWPWSAPDRAPATATCVTSSAL